MKPSLRFEVFKRDAFTCRYCGRKSPDAILEVDHIVPLSAGGPDEIENLVTACYICNRGKGARLLTEIPAENSLHEKAIQIAERELQISEYNHWVAKQRFREDDELGTLEQVWVERWGTDYWKRSEARRFLRVLGFGDLLDILEIVAEKTQPHANRGWSHSAWVFFCGICRTRIKDRANDA